MRHKESTQLHRECQAAFASEIGKTVRAVLSNEQSLTPSQREALLPSLLFAIGAHLSGSSFAGEVQGEEIYPVLGFSKGESEGVVHFGSNSMHEHVQAIIRGLAS